MFESKIVICSSKDIWDEIASKDDSDSEDLDKNDDEPNSVIYPIQKLTKAPVENQYMLFQIVF